MRRGSAAITSLLLAATVISLGPSTVSDAVAQATTRSARRPFELSAVQSIDAEGNVLLVVSTAIDYRRLVFFRQPSGYVADYRIYIELRDDDGKRIRGEVIEKTVTVLDYKMTRSAGMLSEVTKKIPLDSGEYDLRVIIEVEKTSLKYERHTEVRMYGREHGLLEMSDPVFSIPGDPGMGRKPPLGELFFSVCSNEIPDGFRSLAGGVFIGFEGWIRMSWTVLSPMEKRTGRGMEVTVRVRDSRKHIKAYTRQTFDVDEEGRGMFCTEMNVDDLPLGFYEITAAVSIPNSTKKVVRIGNFTMLLGRAMFDEYFEDTLEMLGYMVEEGNIERLRDVSPEERIDEWNRYWKSKDPTRTTDLNEALSDFLRRVRFTLETFGSHGPGWKTDLGRIYIRHGPPDKIVDRDGRTLGSKLKIWYYYSRGIAFIFEDSMGSGLYMLIDTRSI